MQIKYCFEQLVDEIFAKEMRSDLNSKMYVNDIHTFNIFDCLLLLDTDHILELIMSIVRKANFNLNLC